MYRSHPFIEWAMRFELFMALRICYLDTAAINGNLRHLDGSIQRHGFDNSLKLRVVDSPSRRGNTGFLNTKLGHLCGNLIVINIRHGVVIAIFHCVFIFLQ